MARAPLVTSIRVVNNMNEAASSLRHKVNGGGISVGHPFGMTGARLAGHALLEGKRRNVKLVVISMCVGSGMGAAAQFEVA